MRIQITDTRYAYCKIGRRDLDIFDRENGVLYLAASIHSDAVPFTAPMILNAVITHETNRAMDRHPAGRAL